MFRVKTNRARQFNDAMARDIRQRDGSICIYCGAPAQEIDHVISLKDGGITHRSNGVCVCYLCNRKKRDNFNLDMLTRAIFWLSQKGEDISWMDNPLTRRR